MEDLETSVNNSGVADPEQNNIGTENDPTEDANNSGVVEPNAENNGVAPNTEQKTENNNEPPANSNRDYKRDAAIAEFRRKTEESRKEAEAVKRERDRLVSTFRQFGFDGDTDEIIDKANAHYLGKTVEQVRAERLAQAQKEAEQSSLKNKLEYYEKKELQERMEKDLNDIKQLNPAIQSFDDLPQEFFNLVGKGIDGTRAYKLLEVEGLFENKNIKAEQNAIKKIQANGKASVGTLGGGQADPNTSFETMSDAEFEKYIEKAKRGELKQ